METAGGLPRIAIIGAGIGGLMLARILQHNGVPCTIFEKDPDRNTEKHAHTGALSLLKQVGTSAGLETGLLEEFLRNATPERPMKLLKRDGTIAYDETEHQQNPPPLELRRTRLRDILLDAIEPTSIRWNKELVGVAKAANQSQHDLLFTGGGEELGFDLVVGADGPWSEVRTLLTTEEPYYSDITVIAIKVKDTSSEKPWLSNFIGSGALFMFDENRALFSQHDEKGGICTYAALCKPENWIADCGIDWEQHSTARELLIEQCFSDCDENLKRLIAESPESLVPMQLYRLPNGMKWRHHPGVTLLGDAAHLMNPLAGCGVEQAIDDAINLAQALLGQKATFGVNVSSIAIVSYAMREYEKQLFENNRFNMKRSTTTLKAYFSPDGVDRLATALQVDVEQVFIDVMRGAAADPNAD